MTESKKINMRRFRNITKGPLAVTLVKVTEKGPPPQSASIGAKGYIDVPDHAIPSDVLVKKGKGQLKDCGIVAEEAPKPKLKEAEPQKEDAPGNAPEDASGNAPEDAPVGDKKGDDSLTTPPEMVELDKGKGKDDLKRKSRKKTEGNR